ncbi:hypothetical protein DSAG12_01673 [Promethearchaeum syntrophicum]|uniref:Uncharacterized protein n=1 Tax=Promethearchaeum syntrophicum TaxID=2594042 RepID=A0A5B9DB53_9ARCH
MEVLISFIIKNLEGYTDRKIQKDFPEDMLFIEVLNEILKIINGNITLDKISVISAMKGLFSYEDARKTVKEIVAMHLFEFTITKRDLVNGPNLMLKEITSTQPEEDSSKGMQYGYLKPKIESKPTPQPDFIQEPVHIQELVPEPTQEIKSLESEIIGEKLSDIGAIGGKKDTSEVELFFAEKKERKKVKNEILDAKEAIDRMDDMLKESPVEDLLYKAKKETKLTVDDSLEDKLKKSEEKDLKLSTHAPSAPASPPASPPKSLPLSSGSAPPPPGSAPKSPQTLRGGMTEELKTLFSKTKEEETVEPPAEPAADLFARHHMSKRKPKLSTESVSESAPERRRDSSKPSPKKSFPPPSPSPPPPSPEPAVTSASSQPFSIKQKKKGKKMGARMRSLAVKTEEVEETAISLGEKIKEKKIADDFDNDFGAVEEREEEVLENFMETKVPTEFPPSQESTILPEMAGLAKEIETSKEYQKNIAIEYFDKMNPKKYYPLLIDISDLEQATTISEENILTGERKVQVKETMAVVLKSSIVKVKPMFPGCSIVPEERYTDLDEKEDKLTFYVTPLVDDEIEAGRIEFIDSEGNIFHSAPTPTKVEDPRYARVIALYGGLASFLPKILEGLGFSFTEDTNIATLLPFLQSVLGDMNLSNFIGISGILITIIICIITVIVRKPNSVKKKFKVARVGRLKSATKAVK